MRVEQRLNGIGDPSVERISDSPFFLYLVSGKKGFGHVSRSVAIAQRLSQDVPVYYIAHPNVHDFIAGNLQGRNNFSVSDLSYNFSQSDFNPYEYDKEKAQFLVDNPTILKHLAQSSLIISDFVAPIVFVRDVLNETESQTPLIGVYHSFDGFPIEDDDTKTWREKTSRILDALDTVFLIEPTEKHRAPYLTRGGTLVIPCGPVVREITKDHELVKSEIGLSPNDNFILIQAGMRGSKEIEQIIREVSGYLVKTGLKIVVMGGNLDPTGNIPAQNKDIIYVPLKDDGHNLLAAAIGVIAKPGMQTLSECIAYKVPLLFVPDTHPERRLKIEMLKKNFGTNNPAVIDLSKNPAEQIENWLSLGPQIKEAFAKIPCNGASVIADTLVRIHQESHTKDGSSSVTVREDPPPGKEEGHLSLEESLQRIEARRGYIKDNLIVPLIESRHPASLICFGGAARGILRADSDTDLLLVVREEDLDTVPYVFSILKMSEPVTKERIASFKNGTYDSLRLKAVMPDSSELNISVMTEVSYRMIFSPFTRFFKEELGVRISDNPYHIYDFIGGDYIFPKVHQIQTADGVISERRSPGIVAYDGKQLLGVKEKMLLTSEIWHDGLSLGDPSRKLIRSTARAICYWNNLYEFDSDGKVIGLKAEAFNPNYFFRILQDPLGMYNPQKFRTLRNLFLNELRRIDFMARYSIQR